MPEMKNTQLTEAEVTAKGEELSDSDLEDIVAGGVIGVVEKMNWNGGIVRPLQIDFFPRGGAARW